MKPASGCISSIPTGCAWLASSRSRASSTARRCSTAGGNGIEGLEFIPDTTAPGGGYFLLLNQDDPHCIVRVDLAAIANRTPETPVALQAVWTLPDINSGELYYDASAEELWVVHSWMNLVEMLDIHTMQDVRWEVLPGCAQEAVALDGLGRLWIGADSGGLARYLRQQEDS